jgi:hypothetical protein
MACGGFAARQLTRANQFKLFRERWVRQGELFWLSGSTLFKAGRFGTESRFSPAFGCAMLCR